MTRRRLLAVTAVLAAAVGVYFLARPGTRPAEQTVPDAEYAAVLAAVRPTAEEDAFARIPWETSLWEARRKAAAAGKPILLWEMDGHPLGCG